MVAYTHRWLKTRDTPTVTTFECKAYDAEVVAPDLDTSQVQQELQHAQEQLQLSREYPGRAPPRMFKPRIV